MPTDLARLIRSVGQSTFVRFFYQFADNSLSHEDVVGLLPQDYTLKSRHSRTTHARRIFREGLERDALELIIHAERVDDFSRQQARELLRKLS